MKKYILANANVFLKDHFEKADLLIENGLVSSISKKLSQTNDCTYIDCLNYVIIPGLIDVHVHLREPGFSYKETMESGTMACAHGGFTSVCAMPNLNPVPDNYENLKAELDLIEKEARIKVYPYGAITVGEKGESLAAFDEMKDYVIGYSDDGKGVQSEFSMEEAMKQIKNTGKVLAAHCEVEELSKGGYIHDGPYAKAHGHTGIPSSSEYLEIERDIELTEKIGCKYHVCHISTKEGVEFVRQAKKKGLDITCETGPHYLCINDSELEEDARFKMFPPIREKADQDALIAGIIDGTIDMIATDHAPHSAEEKSKGFKLSANGVVGIETSFPVMYTNFVKNGIISFEQLMKLMHSNAMERFNIGQHIEEGAKADLTVFDLNEKYVIDPKDFLSKGKSSPFTGNEVYGKCKLTMVDGEIVWSENIIEK